MMLPGQAVLGGIGQDPAQHPAQRVARQHVVSDVIGRHCLSCRVRSRRWIGGVPWPDSCHAMVPRPGGEVSMHR